MELITRIADARDTVVVCVGGAGGDRDAFASQVLSSSHANTGFKSGVIAFILVAVRSSSADDAVSIDIPDVSEVALAGDTVEGLIGSALSAST